VRAPRGIGRWLIGFFALAIVCGVVLAVLTAWNAGSGWDTPYEISLAEGVLHSLPAGLQPAYDATPYLFEFYGTLNYAIVESIGGVLSPGFVLDPQNTDVYLWLGAWNILIAIAGVAGLSYAVGRALSSAVSGWFLAALIMTTPLWVGHLSMNFKDVPTAVGLSLVSAGLILAWLPEPRRLEWLASGALISLGTAELIGSRASGTVLIGVLVVGSWVLSLFRRRVVAASFFGVLIGMGLVWLQSPFARRGMVRWLADAATTSNINPSSVRFAGADLSSGSLPITYIPGWFLAQLPLLTTALLIAGVAVLILGLAGRIGVLTRERLYPLTPVLIQGVLLPGMIAVSGVIIYDAARHVLFALPAFLVLAVLPLHWVLNTSTLARWWRVTVLATSVAAVGAGLLAGVRWYPYEYAFINPIAGIHHDQRDWELDYWGLTAREGIDRLRALGVDTVGMLPSDDPGAPYGGVNLADLTGSTTPYGAYVYLRYDAALPADCDKQFAIVRDGHTLGVGGICVP
jgi:hypothetical protein